MEKNLQAEASLRQAREQAEGPGTDPQSRKAVPTFREAAEAVIELCSHAWKAGGKTRRSWETSLERHVYPTLGNRAVDEIRRQDVLGVLMPIWRDRQPTARVIRQRIRRVLGWCQAHGHVHGNAADAALDAALPPRPWFARHHRALPYEEVPGAIVALDRCTSCLAARLCLQFLVLTAARSSEAREARWNEIDMDRRAWVVPAERMKSGVEHRQPLSEAALAVLDRASALDDGSGLIFPSPRGRGQPLQSGMLMNALRTAGLADATTVEGFRSAFQNWAIECTDVDHLVRELALGHVVTFHRERAFARSDLFGKRLDLMERWGHFVVASNPLDSVKRSGQSPRKKP